MNTININGNSFSVSGNNITVINGKVMVDGKVVQDNLSGIVKIEFTGDLAKLDCNTAEVHGNINGSVNTNSLECGNIMGNVDANSVKCETIIGDVDANTIKKRK